VLEGAAADTVELRRRVLATEGPNEILEGHRPPPAEEHPGEIADPTAEPEADRAREIGQQEAERCEPRYSHPAQDGTPRATLAPHL
jgi:hypothetical protein